jgi:hypothetical protein
MRKITKKKKRLLLLFVCFSMVFQVKTQEIPAVNFTSSLDHSFFSKPENLGVSSPQVADFIRYGNLTINHYNGLLDLNIGLEEYKDNDFTIPLSLQYISTGFIPTKRPSIVGYNWILKCGGVITRVVYGSPDDVRGYYTNKASERDRYLPDGLLVAIRDKNFKSYSDIDLNNFNIDKNEEGDKNPYLEGDFKYDLEPDVFRFSFGNYEGSFMLDNYGQVVLSSQQGCKINISNLATQTYSTTATPVASSIKITTPDGYIYEFGGDSDYLEYFLPSNPEHAFVRPRYITSWFLESIKAPNNREVTFAYTSRLQKIKYNNFVYAYSSATVKPIVPCSHMMPTTPTDLLDKHLIFEDKVYTPILDNIKIDNTTIKFNTAKSTSGFYDLNEDTDKSYRLNSIDLLYNNSLVKNLNFSYLDKGRYFFLSSYQKDNAKHTFLYNLEKDLPDPMTISTDHWGFWSGGNQTSVSNVARYCLDIHDNRAPNPLFFDVALLKEVVYPTGGRSKIVYESNQYKHYFEREPNILFPYKKIRIYSCKIRRSKGKINCRLRYK